MKVVVDHEFNAESFWKAIDWLNNENLEEPQEGTLRPLVEDVE